MPSLKDSFAVALARSWIRYAPTRLGKEKLWRFVHWRDHRYIARTRHGFRMQGHSNDLVQGYVYYFGTWEPNLTAWLSRRFRAMEARVFVDVGANVGYYSLLAHRLMPRSGTVVAVEASPMIYAMLEDNIRLNKYERVRTVNCAAAAEQGTIALYQGGADNLGGTTTQAGIWEGKGVVVDAKPLSDILTSEDVARIRLIKIDVEGAERSVLEGLRTILSRLPADVELVVEISAGNAEPIFAMFQKEGFNAYSLPNLYSYKCYLSPAAIDLPARLTALPTYHGDVIFSRRDCATL